MLNFDSVLAAVAVLEVLALISYPMYHSEHRLVIERGHLIAPKTEIVCLKEISTVRTNLKSEMFPPTLTRS